MKKYLKISTLAALIIVGIWFIISSLSQSARPPEVAEPPDLPDVPAKAYGVIEPAQREVFVTSSISRPVREIYVDEGDTVSRGQIIVVLENDVEVAQLDAALSHVQAAQKALEMSKYDFDRRENLFSNQTIPEYDYEMARLQMELDSVNVEVAEREARLARERAKQLELRSPIDGIVYKLDVRLGELFHGNDNSLIIVGSPDLWVRLFVESFWRDRFALGSRCNVFDSETNELIGMGTIIGKSRYVSNRNFRTEDISERFDAEFEQVVLELETEKKEIPLGLNVMAVLDAEN